MTSENSVTYLLPKTLRGFPVDVVTSDVEVGGFDILIWKDTNRHDGIMVHQPSLGDVHRFFRSVERDQQGVQYWTFSPCSE